MLSKIILELCVLKSLTFNDERICNGYVIKSGSDDIDYHSNPNHSDTCWVKFEIIS